MSAAQIGTHEVSGHADFDVAGVWTLQPDRAAWGDGPDSEDRVIAIRGTDRCPR